MSARRLPHDWFPADLPGNVHLGEGAWLYSSYACLHLRSRRPRAVVVGRDTGVYDGTMFDLGPSGEVTIGELCTVVGAVFSTNRRVVVGDRVFVAHEVVIADGPFGRPCLGDEPEALPTAPGVVLEEASWVGAGAVLLAGAHVGVGSIVGAGAVIDFEVPAYTVAAGNPARIVGAVRKSQAPGAR